MTGSPPLPPLASQFTAMHDVMVMPIAALLLSGAFASLSATLLLVYVPVAYVLFGIAITVFAVATEQFYASKLLVMYSWLLMQYIASALCSAHPHTFKVLFSLLWPIQFLVFPSLAPATTPRPAMAMLWLSSVSLSAVPVSLIWHGGGLQPLHDGGRRWRNWHYPAKWLTVDFEILYNLWFCSFWSLKGEYGILMFLAFQSNYYMCERIIVCLTNFRGDAATLWPSVRIVSATFYLILDPLYTLDKPLVNVSVACNMLFLGYQAFCHTRWLRGMLDRNKADSALMANSEPSHHMTCAQDNTSSRSTTDV